MSNRALEGMRRFSEAYGRSLALDRRIWRYCRLGDGPPLFWLGGGLRRAALGFAFMERLAERRTLIAPDYPPTTTFRELDSGFARILETEGVERFSLGGQSYGGILAQGFLALHPRSGASSIRRRSRRGRGASSCWRRRTIRPSGGATWVAAKGLFGREVEVMGLGGAGHTALLRDPDAFAGLLDRALS